MASGFHSPKRKARVVRIAASCFIVIGDSTLNVSLFTIVGDGASTSRNSKVIVGDGFSTSRKTGVIFILRQTSSTASGPPSPKWKARAVRIAASCFTIVGDGALDVPQNRSGFYFTSNLFHRKRSPFPKVEGKSGENCGKLFYNRRGRRPRRTLKNACIFKNMASRNVKIFSPSKAKI